MVAVDKSTRQGIISRFLGGLRFPQLFLLCAGLFVLDFFLLDPIPFVDEAIAALLAIMLAMWKDRKGDETAELEKPPEKNITPQ